MRLAERILGEDGGAPEGFGTRAVTIGGGLSLELRRHRGDKLLALLGRQVLQARERIEFQGLAGGILEAAEVFAAAAGEVLLGAVEPPPFESLPLRS
jgi:hypothetical protein